MSNEKHLINRTENTGATHTHTQRNGGRGLYLHLSASCGLVELVRWWDSNPPPTTQHQAPGTRNDATDASQHGNGPDETPAGKTRLPLFLLFLDDGVNLLFSSTTRHLLLSFPSPAGRGKRYEVLASGLDEGLSGDSWPLLIGRAHGGWREPHPCT